MAVRNNKGNLDEFHCSWNHRILFIFIKIVKKRQMGKYTKRSEGGHAEVGGLGCNYV